MPNIILRGDNAESIQALSNELAQDLHRLELDNLLRLSEAELETSDEVTRGDPITWFTVILAAAGAGGALTTMLGKDGFLSALARVLEKVVEGRKAEVLIQNKSGKKIQITGPVSEIKEILKQIRDE